VSRAHNARRKAKRQQARGVAASAPRRHVRPSRRLGVILPLLAIAAALAATAVLGFGADKATSREEVDREVSELLAGIPQEGTTLGEPKAPITLRVFADLECPTVRRFVVSRLPSIIDTWVRKGVIKLEYRSLETDTANERTFYTQEVAALAAGRQDRMWNFVLTAVHEQQFKRIDLGQQGLSQVTGIQHSDYVDEEFLTDIASRVSGLASIHQ
jgi:Thioredoxin